MWGRERPTENNTLREKQFSEGVGNNALKLREKQTKTRQKYMEVEEILHGGWSKYILVDEENIPSEVRKIFLGKWHLVQTWKIYLCKCVKYYFAGEANITLQAKKNSVVRQGKVTFQVRKTLSIVESRRKVEKGQKYNVKHQANKYCKIYADGFYQ